VKTTFGATTDIEGRYTILNIPPGIHSLRASLVGYNPITINEVKVSIDLTTEQNFDLTEVVLEQQEVVITAERPLIQKDITASTAIVGKELIKELAVTEVRDIIQLQAGMVSSGGDLHLRGGRKGQIAFQVDGVPVTDAYDGSNTIDIGANVIQELQVVSGAFNAEYGQAMSGIVNIVTKDGDNTLAGTFQTYSGAYLSRKDDIFWNIKKVDPVAIKSFEGSLSGPVIEDKLFFFLNSRYYYNTGHLYGKRVFLTTDRSREDPSSVGSNFIITQNGDGSFVSMNSNKRAYAQGKLTYRLMNDLKLTNNYIYDYQNYQDFDAGVRMTPDNNLQRFRNTHTNIFSINHVLSPASFYTLSFSYLRKGYEHFLFEDIYTGDTTRPTLYVDNSLKQNPPYSFDIGGTNTNRFKRATTTLSVKLDWTTQANTEIALQWGGEIKRHEIFFQNINLVPMLDQSGQKVSPFNVINPPITSPDYDEYNHKPVEAALYLQSKFEAFHIIFNAGVRFDVLNPDGVILNDPTDPNINSPLKPENQFFDLNGNGVLDTALGEQRKTISDRLGYWYRDASTKYQLSPRLGLAFPISAGGVVHFSYGHFFQLPGYELLYTNPAFKLGIGSGNQGLFGNADLKPQKTIKGEIGIKQQLSEDIAADVTVFFEDFRDLTGTQTEDILVFGRDRSYSKYTNSDFGMSKGVVVKLEKRFTEGLAATLDYTYSVTEGNGSNPTDARNAVLGGAAPETFIAPLDWDQRHTMNLIVAYTKPHSYGCSIIGNFYAGQPYTPAVNKNSSVKQNAFPRNSSYKPNIFNVDIRANKDFSIGNITYSLFLRVFNLLDLNNPRTVYANSGDPLFSFDKLDAENINPKLYYNTLDELYTNPGYFSEPRRVELGMSITF
ncbi:MAG TPA: carboxypeptidase-like regulatory domain-containing protein, partial [Bacteroidota bacterium]|nr:carboxypeptidase-like regulatory domain-containing protein [Bacteroidota bacterium]